MAALQEAYLKRKEQLGPDDPNTVGTLSSLAVACFDASQFEKAVPLFEEALTRRRALVGADHVDTLLTMGSLASAYHQSGQIEKAIPLYEAAVEKLRPRLGPVHPNLLINMNNLGKAHWEAGHIDEAVVILTETLTRAQEKLGRDHPLAFSALDNLAAAHCAGNHAGTAEPLLRELLAIRQQKEPDAWTTFNTKSMLGAVLADQKKFAEAEPLLVAGYEGMKQRKATIPPQRQVRLTQALQSLIWLYDDWGKPAAGAKWRAHLAPGARIQEALDRPYAWPLLWGWPRF
jgi:tetratricopeptide (TPR) repeat protein